MSQVKALLDAVKAEANITTDYALAKLLDIPNGYICRYNQGKLFPNEYACLKIAEILKRDYAEISAIVRIEAERDESRKEAWRKYYKSIGGVAATFATLFFLAVTLIVTPTPANASIGKDSTRADLYYVKFSCRWHLLKAAIEAVLNTIKAALPRVYFVG